MLNDATLEDALAAGLDTCSAIVDNGSAAPGTILDLCSAEFRELFERAPLIIAKGQANCETLSEAGPRVFLCVAGEVPRHRGRSGGTRRRSRCQAKPEPARQLTEVITVEDSGTRREFDQGVLRPL